MKIIKNKNSQIELITRSFIIIALVIFVSLFLIYLNSLNISHKRTDNLFSSLYNTNNAFLKITSNPCYIIGANEQRIIKPNSFSINHNYYNFTNIRAVFDVNKLKKYSYTTNIESDLSCTNGIPYLIGFSIEDMLKQNKWYLGFTKNDISTYNISRNDMSLFKIQKYPVALQYSDKTILPAMMEIYYYKGNYVNLYNKIKSSSYSNKNGKQYIKLRINNKISYNDTTNLFCFSKLCFFASFGCKVNSFHLNPGILIITINKKNSNIWIS